MIFVLWKGDEKITVCGLHNNKKTSPESFFFFT